MQHLKTNFMAAKKEKNVEAKPEVQKLGEAYRLVSSKNGVEYQVELRISYDPKDKKKRVSISKPEHLHFQSGSPCTFKFQNSEPELVEEVLKLMLAAVEVAKKA